MDSFRNLLFSLIYLILSSCCCNQSANIENMAKNHEHRLREHFKGARASDVSTLIMETRLLSAQLKQRGMTERANKFDSYTDVLMFGNNTLDESLNDVMDLVRKKDCLPSSLCELKQMLFCCDC